MADAAYRLYADNQPLDAEHLALFSEIKVDQAIGMAAEAELSLYIGTDDGGLWSGMEEAFAQPSARLRVEAKVGTGPFVPLLDGPVAAQRYELSADPGTSRLVIVVQDDSVLLNREEKVEVFEDMGDADIARAIIGELGLVPDVDDIPAAESALGRVQVQRGTPMQLLKDLAARHGFLVYVKAGASPRTSTASLKRPALAPAGYPDLLLTGPDRNVAGFAAHFDALRPAAVSAGAVRIADRTAIVSEKSATSLDLLGAEGTLDILPAPAITLLARHREEQADLDEAAQAAVDLSTWAWVASTEVVAGTYNTVLEPHKVLTVRGVGGRLSGDWLISRVVHVLDAQQYRQQLTLRRNARSAGPGGGGGLPGGLF